MNDFPTRLKLAAKEAGITQADIARRLKIKAPSVSAWFNGLAMPSGRNMVRLAAILRVDPQRLSDGNVVLLPPGLPKDWSLDGDKIRAGLEEGTDSEMLVAVGTRVLEEIRTYKPALAPAQTAQLIALLYGLAMDRLKDGKSRKAALPIGADIRNYAKLLPSTESPPKPRSPKR